MWVWSDELVERSKPDGVDIREPVPLVAYAIGSEAELEQLALEVLSETRADVGEARSATRRGVDR